jgi:LysM repeat protein
MKKVIKKVVAVSSLLFALSFISDSNALASHTVTKGDTLYEIAKKYHVSVSQLKEHNNLKSNKLKIGTQLTVPESALPEKKRDVTATSSSRRDKQSVQAKEGNYHTVSKGDTLSKIARKYSIPQSELVEMNNMKTSRLKVGQEVLIKSSAPKTYTVKKGDTLSHIAKRYKISTAKLKQLNDLQKTALKPGQRLVIARKTEEPSSETTVSSSATSEKMKTPLLASTRIKEVAELSSSDNIADLSITERLTLFAKKMLHMPYKFGGNGSIGLDCSAYVQKVFSFAGIDLPRSAREQFTIGEAVDREELSIGDLVFFRTYASFPSHVGIYLGNNLFIHASSKSKKVTIDSLDTPYYFKRFIGAKRLLAEGEQDVRIE